MSSLRTDGVRLTRPDDGPRARVPRRVRRIVQGVLKGTRLPLSAIRAVGRRIRWTVLHHEEYEAEIDDVLETGARDRGPGLVLFCVRRSGAGGGRRRYAEAL